MDSYFNYPQNNIECDICCYEFTTENMPCTTRNCNKLICFECALKVKDLRCPYCQSGYLDIPKGVITSEYGIDNCFDFESRKVYVLGWSEIVIDHILRAGEDTGGSR